MGRYSRGDCIVHIEVWEKWREIEAQLYRGLVVFLTECVSERRGRVVKELLSRGTLYYRGNELRVTRKHRY